MALRTPTDNAGASSRAWTLCLLTPISLLAFWILAAPIVAHPAERFYLVVPWVYAAGALWMALIGARRDALRRALVCAALVAGLGAVFLYARRRPPQALADGELVVMAYGLCAVVLVTRWMYLGLAWIVRRVLPNGAEASRWRALCLRLLTILLFSVVACGYLMAVLQTHFPKRRSMITPRMVRLAFADIRFAARDGLELAGWFVPAKDAQRTAIVCHGVGADKSDMLDFVAALTAGGYNVLAFDFRGHGASAGHTVSYGKREMLDILGAVDWVRAHEPRAAQHIVGVGWSMGAASLILAAAEDPRIEALHLDAAYARTRDIARVIAAPFPPVYEQLGLHIGLVLGSLEAGVNLYTLAPVEVIAGIAPRPIMLVHGEEDELIAIEQGRLLFAAAGEPKWFHPIAGAGHCATINVETPRYEQRMLEFLDKALASASAPP